VLVGVVKLIGRPELEKAGAYIHLGEFDILAIVG
jgi:hypothetical protein